MPIKPNTQQVHRHTYPEQVQRVNKTSSSSSPTMVQRTTNTPLFQHHRFTVEDGGASPLAPHIGRDQQVPSGTFTPLGLLTSDRGDLVALHHQVEREIDYAVGSFPKSVQPGIHDALDISTARIIEAHDEGRIDAEEAALSMEMMREMVEALGDIRTGNAVITQHKEHSENVQVWNITSPDGDEVMLATRYKLDEQGEARVSFRHLKDDGVALKGRHRMHVRVDLERWGTPSVDVQFGTTALDKRIHGLYKNPDGSVFTTESGKKLADHHFRDNLPATLQDPDHFATMVEHFIDGTITPLPITAIQPQSGTP